MQDYNYDLEALKPWKSKYGGNHIVYIAWVPSNILAASILAFIVVTIPSNRS